MRFTSRSTQTKTSPATPDHVVQLGGTALPQKAEPFFGGRTRLGRKKSVKPGTLKQTREGPPSDEQKSRDPSPRAQDLLSLDLPQSLLDDMPGHKGGLNVWPNLDRENRSATDLRNRHVYSPATRPGVPPRTSSNSAVHKHYDPSKHPYYVSQQTSDSAVRDMSLHKGPSMTLHETASDPALTKRPLKSALKTHSSPDEITEQPESPLRVKTSSGEKKPRRLDLSHFFPVSRNNSRNLLSPNTLSRSPSALTDSSDFAPQETVHVQLKRPAANAPYATHKTVKPPSVDSGSTTRAKVFEADIFDQAKTNVRRPPKGIQNWFDGFDISTDEESEPEPAKQKTPEPQELPANDMPSPFSLWHIKSDSEQPRLDRKASRDPVEDNLLAIKHAKERIQERMRLVDQRKGSFDTATLGSVVSSEAPVQKRGGSRLALLELASQSVLSLSESSGDEKVGAQPSHANVDDASVVVMASNAPSEPPRKLQSKRSTHSENMPRQSTSTVQTSGSIPIRLTESIPLPVARPPLPDAKRAAYTSHPDPTAQALRKLNGQVTPRSSRSRRTTRTQDSETIVSVDTTSSMLSDGSHMMAVSEEEMILLEMMRNKRAAMQSNSFAEGYSLALKREQELMVKRRESAQHTAMKILKQREEKVYSQRNSKATGPFDEMEDLEEQYRRKYSAIRKEEVDKALKLEKFLADMKTPTMDSFPEPPLRAESAEEMYRRPPQKFELLLPRAYSPTPSRMLDEMSAQGSSPAPESEDIEDQVRQVRQFLASNSASEVTGAFPTPPSAKSKPDSRREKRRSIMSPSPVAEEEDMPQMPLLSRRTPEDEPRERRRSINGRRLSAHQLDLDTLPVRTSAMPAPLRQATQQQQPYYLTPNFDFSPLDFPASGGTGQLTTSPSLSTSRASPLTPTFVTLPPSEKPAIEGASSSDNASYRGRAYTPDTDLTSLSASAPTSATPASSRKRGGVARKKMPPKLNTIASNASIERGDGASITSAGEDVLAAWASLGGGAVFARH